MRNDDHKIAFRTDASGQIGMGHFMRCLTLADTLKRCGSRTRFLSRFLPQSMRDLLSKKGHEFRLLDSSPCKTMSNGMAHTHWLGTSQLDDARDCIRALSDQHWDWLVVDHYALDQTWESALRSSVNKIFVIDDLVDRRHDCDLLLNQNVFPAADLPYQGMLSANCGLLLGPSYALLQPDYQDFRRRAVPREGKVRTILVYFGGGDADNMTGRTLAALARIGRTDIGIDVVMPVGSPHKDDIRRQARQIAGDVRLHEVLPSLAQLMVTADLAIGAGGTTSWERLCLGLPALVVTLSDNQVMIADVLNRQQLAKWIGHYNTVSNDQLTAAIEALVNTPLSPEWSVRCRAAVDGNGAQRVVAVMAYGSGSVLKVRSASLDDGSLIGGWAECIFLSDNIIKSQDWDNGQVCYRTFLRNLGNSHLYVIETDMGATIGVVHASISNSSWNLVSAVSPAMVGHEDVGWRCLVAALRQLRNDERSVLHIHKKDILNNEAPLRRRAVNTLAPLQVAICSDESSWINDFIPGPLLEWLENGYQIFWGHDAAQLPGGDICFYLSYSRIVGKSLLAKYRNNLVVHESALPAGRGWSPMTWQVLRGADEITVTLFEASEQVDAGEIYLQTKVHLLGTELVNELRTLQAQATFDLCSEFLAGYPETACHGLQQSGTPQYFSRRTAADSRVDLALPLREQINLLRVCDNERYPAWFEFLGSRFVLKVSKW
ncbi:MAG: UDP-2,4-diacetamido-2,4,6-trideoxy-beta-L-altropyranose hydrolase [Syntrophaceae bacterium]|nr:UDP-2,4-diacetamido-2,4,6-trideoxy-beta-L-altropyranose hydrolase [Syntrophaceae bacterium]